MRPATFVILCCALQYITAQSYNGNGLLGGATGYGAANGLLDAGFQAGVGVGGIGAVQYGAQIGSNGYNSGAGGFGAPGFGPVLNGLGANGYISGAGGLGSTGYSSGLGSTGYVPVFNGLGTTGYNPGTVVNKVADALNQYASTPDTVSSYLNGAGNSGLGGYTATNYGTGTAGLSTTGYDTSAINNKVADAINQYASAYNTANSVINTPNGNNGQGGYTVNNYGTGTGGLSATGYDTSAINDKVADALNQYNTASSLINNAGGSNGQGYTVTNYGTGAAGLSTTGYDTSAINDKVADALNQYNTASSQINSASENSGQVYPVNNYGPGTGVPSTTSYDTSAINAKVASALNQYNTASYTAPTVINGASGNSGIGYNAGVGGYWTGYGAGVSPAYYGYGAPSSSYNTGAGGLGSGYNYNTGVSGFDTTGYNTGAGGYWSNYGNGGYNNGYGNQAQTPVYN